MLPSNLFSVTCHSKTSSVMCAFMKCFTHEMAALLRMSERQRMCGRYVIGQLEELSV